MLERLRAGADWALCCIVALSACCNHRVLESPKASANDRPAESRLVRYLDAKNPTLVYAIEAGDSAASAKFVEVEIVNVQNPKQYTTTFRVDYQSQAGEKIFLGTFSLYPADNPGRFIVPTSGKLKNEGAVLVTLVLPDDFKSGDVLKIGVGKVKFVAERDR
ncbi:MAG TPA: hypothetical protein VN696_04000 [Pyrinomonadaceae bacterium]|nr:hypothetical protein [Pyrinomonadaceae bacterium]